MATEMNTEGLCLQRWDHSDKPVLWTALCRGSDDIAAIWMSVVQPLKIQGFSTAYSLAGAKAIWKQGEEYQVPCAG